MDNHEKKILQDDNEELKNILNNKKVYTVLNSTFTTINKNI